MCPNVISTSVRPNPCPFLHTAIRMFYGYTSRKVHKGPEIIFCWLQLRLTMVNNVLSTISTLFWNVLCACTLRMYDVSKCPRLNTYTQNTYSNHGGRKMLFNGLLLWVEVKGQIRKCISRTVRLVPCLYPIKYRDRLWVYHSINFIGYVVQRSDVTLPGSRYQDIRVRWLVSTAI